MTLGLLLLAMALLLLDMYVLEKRGSSDKKRKKKVSFAGEDYLKPKVSRSFRSI